MLVQRENLAFEDQTYKLRPPDMDDVTAIVNLLNICAIDQTGQADMTRAELVAEWTTPRFKPAESIRVVETANGEITGYIEVWDTDPLPVANFVWARVHPDFEGLGIGTALMRWADKRLQKTLARVPEDLRVTYRSSALSTHAPSKNLFEGLGMTLSRYFWRMRIDLDGPQAAPRWPDGITIRTFAETRDLRDVYRAFDDAFRDHWGHVDQPEDQMVEKWKHWNTSDKEFDPAYWFLAMDGDEIAGVCLCRKRSQEDLHTGYVNVLGVRRQWRKQGLALAMLQHAFAELRSIGRLRVELGVDADSLTGATRLYKKAGMRVVKEFSAYEKVLRPGRDIGRQTLDG